MQWKEIHFSENGSRVPLFFMYASIVKQKAIYRLAAFWSIFLITYIKKTVTWLGHFVP